MSRKRGELRLKTMAVKIKENPDNQLYDFAHMLDNYVDSWVHIAFQIIPPHTQDTNYLPWKCFSCQKDIRIKYDTKNHKDFCCSECRKHLVLPKPNAIMLRYMWSFNIMVQNKLIKNSGNLEDILALKSDEIPKSEKKI